MQIKDVVLKKEKDEVIALLNAASLDYDSDIEETIALYDEGTLIATASYAVNIIKCVAVKASYQGQSLLATLITELIKRLAQRNRHHVFVYTKPHQEALFESLGFKRIVASDTMSFLERGADITSRLVSLKETYNINNEPCACVVVNANPMTLGHKHLIDHARKHFKHVLVFVVSENRSTFSFEARINIVKKTYEACEHVIVLPTLDYLVSFATFPKYFLKEETLINEAHAAIDVLTFKEYFMPIFNIHARFVGEEPLSPMTNSYNKVMKQVLKEQLHIIPRLTLLNEVVSASTVRAYLKAGEIEKALTYLPPASQAYLKSEEGKRAIEAMKHETRRH